MTTYVWPLFVYPTFPVLPGDIWSFVPPVGSCVKSKLPQYAGFPLFASIAKSFNAGFVIDGPAQSDIWPGGQELPLYEWPGIIL
jgi:hypothetical protein